MSQLIFYIFRVLLLATAFAALGIHYLMEPLSKPVLLVLFGIIGVTILSGIFGSRKEEEEIH